MLDKSLQLPKVIGHRGACRYAPENTLASMRKAAELGVSWVEFDVMLTADDVAIVIHDDTLDRTTNGKGEVVKTSYSVIADLDAGSWFSPEFAGEKIPTFIELLKCVAELKLGINVEIKPTVGRERETAQKVISILQQYWIKTHLPLLISSFSPISLKEVRDADKTLPLGMLMHHWFEDWQITLDLLGAISLHARHSILNRKRVKEIKDYGRYVLAYTVNSPEKANQLYSWGVDALFSNVPDIILKQANFK